LRISALVRTSTLVVTVVLGTALLGTLPTYAAEPAPPVVGPDTVNLWPGQMTQVDLLANDSSPAGDDLALCRFPDSDFLADRFPNVLVSHSMVPILGDTPAGPGSVLVGVRPRTRGTHTIDYYVCDHTRLAPAVLTVVVRDVQPIKVSKVVGKKGLLEVTNDNVAPIRFLFGARFGKRDGVLKVPAGTTRTVRVQRPTINWLALIGPGSLKGDGFASPGTAGHGVVKHIKVKGDPLPKPRGVDSTTSQLVPGRWGA
jgi:hypothetical protein